MFQDKNRKRGLRIAQKSTYKHHSHDNLSHVWHGYKDPCWNCEGSSYSKCWECAFWFYHKHGGAEFDNELKEYNI